MRLRSRVVRLERFLPPRPASAAEDLKRQRRWHQVVDRWERLLRGAEPLLSAAEQEHVDLALKALVDNCGGPCADWLRDLRDGWCRLPELSPKAMKELLLAWLSPQADGGQVCCRCGLEYPRHQIPPLRAWKLLPGKKPLEGPPPWYDLPMLFSVCPGCGAASADFDWPHRTRECRRAWMDEDGFVGQ
jgi:hypothetical protein